MSHTTHANARLTPAGRLVLARCIVGQEWILCRAAERFQVAQTTAKRWTGRYRAHGQVGMVDASSRLHYLPRGTPTPCECRAIALRHHQWWGLPASVANFTFAPSSCTES